MYDNGAPHNPFDAGANGAAFIDNSGAVPGYFAARQFGRQATVESYDELLNSGRKNFNHV
jgi:hypothetical protein